MDLFLSTQQYFDQNGLLSRLQMGNLIKIIFFLLEIKIWTWLLIFTWTSQYRLQYITIVYNHANCNQVVPGFFTLIDFPLSLGI